MCNGVPITRTRRTRGVPRTGSESSPRTASRSPQTRTILCKDAQRLLFHVLHFVQNQSIHNQVLEASVFFLEKRLFPPVGGRRTLARAYAPFEDVKMLTLWVPGQLGAASRIPQNTRRRVPSNVTQMRPSCETAVSSGVTGTCRESFSMIRVTIMPPLGRRRLATSLIDSASPPCKVACGGVAVDHLTPSTRPRRRWR